MSTDAEVILQRCQQAGIRLRPGDGDRIKVKPIAAITPELAAEMSRRAEIDVPDRQF